MEYPEFGGLSALKAVRMIDEKVISLADRRLSAILADRKEVTGLEISRVKSEAAAANMFQSSRTLLFVSKVHESEIAIQGALAWQVLRDCIIAANIEFGSDEGALAKEWISQKLAASAAEMKQVWAEDQSLKFSKVVPFETRLDEAAQRVLNKTATDIDLYALASEGGSSPEAPRMSVVIQNVGTIQALQTGAGSVANISKSITQTDQESLLVALAAVRTALETLDKTQHPGKEEVLELVAELGTEAAKERPNSLKVASGLSAIGQSISTVAALKPSYEAIKGVAAFFGVSLP